MSGPLPEYGRFVHFSAEPTIEIEQRFVSEAPPFRKPWGAFWFSHEPPPEDTDRHGWYTFCIESEHEIRKLRWAHPVALAPDARVYVGDTVEALEALSNEYGVMNPQPLGEEAWDEIDWTRVARDWQAVLVSPWRGWRFSGRKHRWLDGWDCAAGAVLDTSIVRLSGAVPGSTFAMQARR